MNVPVELDDSGVEVESALLDVLSDEGGVFEGRVVSAVLFELEQHWFRSLIFF